VSRYTLTDRPRYSIQIIRKSINWGFLSSLRSPDKRDPRLIREMTSRAGQLNGYTLNLWDAPDVKAYFRPEPVLPGRPAKGNYAATVAVHSQQYVLTLSAKTCHSGCMP
jgi:hypothetical protein